jgi:MFS family permease
VIPIVAVVWLILAVGNGLFFSFPIFFVPLLEEFHWSRALTAGALSLSTAVQGVLAPVAGILADRFGTRPVILAGVVLLSAGSVLAGEIHAPWHLYLCTGVVAALGLVGLGWVPMGTLLSRRVSERRGRMMGIAFSGMGIGVFTIGPVTQWLINLFGWRTASVILGAAAFAILFPLAWLGVRDAPTRRRAGNGAGRPKPVERAVGVSDGPPRSRRDHGTGTPDATLGDALRTRAFWALALAYFMTPLAVFSVLIHQVAFAVDLGFPRMLVASVFGAMGLMSTVGRVGFGIITDRAGGPVSATISFACTAGGALALLALDLRPHPAWLVVYALLFGLGFGARGPIITAMATDLFGGRHFGVIYGALSVGNGIAGAAGPWFGGLVHDVTGSYRVVFVFSVVASAIGAACFWAVRPQRVRP